MPEKKVEVKVDTDVNMEKVKSLESTIQQLKKQKLELDIDARTQELEETERRIESLKIFLDTVNSGNTNIHIDDSEIKKAEAELEELESEKIDLEIALESDKLDAVKVEIEDLDGTRVNIDLDNSTALQAIDQISQGFSRLKEGVFEIKDAFSEILSSAGSQEMNKTFLEMNLGAEGAKSALQDINSIVANLPGDDTALQGLLSQAAAKNAGITRNELEGMAVAATDYFSAMSFYGKSATEAQQDMTNYILAGNTAELERSPILQGHIDKLKEGTTIQERSQLLQEALNEAGWGGISQQDTYNNKLETFNGMLERGRYNLGGMFQEGAKGAMDFALQLDEATNGAVGMGFALAGFASPLADSVMGLGQMATGFKAIKDLGIISWLGELIPVQIAEGTAGWFSIGWIAVAILLGIALGLALIYLYNHSEKFRNAVQWLGNKLQWLAGILVSNISNAVNQFSKIVEGIPNALKACLDWAYNLVMSHPLVQALIWLGNQAANAFAVLGLGQRSPGKIVKAMKQELDWTSEAIYKSDLASDTARLGSSLSDSFNHNLNVNNVSGAGVSGSSGGTVINVYGNVDSDDRVREILEIVRRELSWNNATAGRTI